MKLRTFKELHQDMRDNRDIYPKRGSSFEEVAVLNLMDVVYYFNNIKEKIYYSIRDEESKESFKFFEEIMHQKFDVIESLLKDCNIDYYERNHKENSVVGDNK